MIYKGYTGTYGFEDGVYHGRVQGIRDIVTFEAEKEENIELEFRVSVEDYLDFCATLRVEPNPPGSALELIDIWNCSACGEQHNDLPIRPLMEEDKEEALGVVFLKTVKYVALCPKTQKKVFVSFNP